MEKKENVDLLSVMGFLGEEILENNDESKEYLNVLILKQRESVEFAMLKDNDRSKEALQLYFNGCDIAEKESDRDKIMSILIEISVKLEELYKLSEYKEDDLNILNKRLFIRAYSIDKFLKESFKVKEVFINDNNSILIEEEIDFFNRIEKLDSKLSEARSIYLEYKLAMREIQDLLSLTSAYYLALDRLNLLAEDVDNDGFNDYYETLDSLMNLRFNEAIEILNLNNGEKIIDDIS